MSEAPCEGEKLGLTETLDTCRATCRRQWDCWWGESRWKERQEPEGNKGEEEEEEEEEERGKSNRGTVQLLVRVKRGCE